MRRIASLAAIGILFWVGDSVAQTANDFIFANSQTPYGGASLILNGSVSAPAAGNQNGGNSGWQAMGTYSVPGGAPGSGPSVSGMTPVRSTSVGPTQYTFNFADTAGYQDIAMADILINTAVDGRQACCVAFVPATKSVLLVDDAGDAGGPYQGLVLPSNSSISNSQCTINGVGSSVVGSGNSLTLILNITFSQSFAGNQVFYLASGNSTQNSNWQAVGLVSVP